MRVRTPLARSAVWAALPALVVVVTLLLVRSGALRWPAAHAQETPQQQQALTPLTGVKAVQAAQRVGCALTTAGSVKCWGEGYGLSAVDVPGLTSGVKMLARTNWHGCVVTTAGGVKCWGINDFGQLGDGSTNESHTPVDVVGLSSGVQTVAVGSNHSCAIMTTGGVQCWGANYGGQLGDGGTTDRHTPTQATGLSSGVNAIAAGDRHTCALLDGGAVKCWGDSPDGQVGDGTTEQRLTPVNVVGLSSGVQAIAVGYMHTCAVLSDGGIQCWGYGDYGQLGDGKNGRTSTPVDVIDLGSRALAVTANTYHTCARLEGGTAKCWGMNHFGQLGDGSTVDRLAPVAVSGLASGVQDLSPGGDFTCAVTAAGGVQCWGLNGNGELGRGMNLLILQPATAAGITSGAQTVSAGDSTTCVLTTSGGAQCWGTGNSGALGDGTDTSRVTPADVTGLGSGVQAVYAGEYYYGCAVTSAGGAKCWGSNWFGALGTTLQPLDHLTPTDVMGLTSGVRMLAPGYDHNCAVTSAGGAKCWGTNNYGQVGDGTTDSRETAVDVSGLTSGVAAIATGFQHTCALTTAGGVKCWGGNDHGQLGNGTTTGSPTPADVSGLASGIKAIAVGDTGVCALTTGGGVKCWGRLAAGPNDTSPDQSYRPVDVPGLSSGVQAIAVGVGHACALTTGGGVKCWGSNAAGQLGDGTTEHRYTPVAVAGLDAGAKAISASGGHTCAVTGSGGVKCWGTKVGGKLGIDPGWHPDDVVVEAAPPPPTPFPTPEGTPFYLPAVNR